MSAGRILVGNLDCESSWRRGGPPTHSALDTASAFATLLRVLAAPGDRLWTPRPVAAERLPEVAGLAMPMLVSGPLSGCAPTASICAWGETREVAALRVPSAAALQPALSAKTTAKTTEKPSTTLRQRLWHLPAPIPAVAARVNHRRYGFDLAQRLNRALAGSAWIESSEALRRHLREVGERVGDWVVKAPLSSAGRDRCIVRKGEATGPVLRRVERLIDLSGGALFEPWVARGQDLGACGWVGEERVHLLGLHRQRIGPAGRFEGVALEPAGPALPAEFGAEIEQTARQVGEQLRRDDYRGAFAVDAYLYRTPKGTTRLNALCEINARMSFGLVARLFAERFANGDGAEAVERKVELRLTTTEPIPTGSMTVPLLIPAPGQPAAAWLTVG